jgi:hypothetical protein
MNTPELVLTLLSIALASAGVIKWYIDTQLKPLNDAIQDVRKETQTNGGSSMRDEIRYIKKEQEEAKIVRKEQKDKIDHLYDLFIEYISSNKK